jgi:hypothetical protein
MNHYRGVKPLHANDESVHMSSYSNLFNILSQILRLLLKINSTAIRLYEMKLRIPSFTHYGPINSTLVLIAFGFRREQDCTIIHEEGFISKFRIFNPAIIINIVIPEFALIVAQRINQFLMEFATSGKSMIMWSSGAIKLTSLPSKNVSPNISSKQVF